jgi:hypothetical protein
MADQTTGFGTRITIAGTVTVSFEEVDTTPASLTKDDKVEQTSNAATQHRRYAPAPLTMKEPATATVYYQKDTNLADIKTLVEDTTVATVTFAFADGSTLADQGWLQSFEVDAQSPTERPTATITIEFEGESSAGVDGWTYTS